MNSPLRACQFTIAFCAAIFLLMGVDPEFYQQVIVLGDLPHFALILAPYLNLLIYIGCAALVLAAFGVYSSFSLPIGTATFAAVLWLTSLGWPLWNYVSHLLFGLVLLTLHQWSGRSGNNRSILPNLKILFAAVYLQAGLSKLIYGGVEWFWGGKTIYVYAQIIGTPLAHGLIGHHALFRAATMSSFVIELLLPFLLFVRRLEVYAMAIFIAFHVGIWLVIGISFWHLWIPLSVIVLATRNSYADKSI